MSKDRPGLIADVTGVVFALEGDLADLNQSLLGDHLTMILIASFPPAVTADAIRQRITALPSDDPIEAIVRPLDEEVELSDTTLPEKTYVVCAQGENKSGLVYGISSFCSERDINIIDLTTTLAAGQYTMILLLDLSRVGSIKKLRTELDSYGHQAGLKVVMQHYDIFKATNEVSLV